MCLVHISRYVVQECRFNNQDFISCADRDGFHKSSHILCRYLCIAMYKGWHSIILCTPIFILGQDEKQETTTEIVGGQKLNCVLAGQEYG